MKSAIIWLQLGASLRQICFAAAALFLCVCPVFALIELNDGLAYDIDYTVNDDVRVDYQASSMYTKVNLLSGGRIRYNLYGYEDSRISIRGGDIRRFYSHDYSQTSIFGGSMYDLISYDCSRINIYGGSIGNDLSLSNQSTIRIFGSVFAVDGQPVGYGKITSILGGSPENESLRRLTGTLLSGALIDNDFYIGHDARIILVPEPATIFLFGLGALCLRKRRK